MKHTLEYIKNKIQSQIEKHVKLTKATHSYMPDSNVTRRAYWKGYVEAKKEDLGLLGEQEKELREIEALIDDQWDSISQLIPCRAPCARLIERIFKRFKEFLGDEAER